MTTAPTIKRIPPPTVGMDFWQLRREGIEYIIRLGSDFWTDYNIHDPGITMLEVLCYAITDLSYRSNLPIGDLLATQSGNVPPSGMPLAPEVLTCNAVTFADFRKLLIDIDGVKNAWVGKATLKSKDTEGWIKFKITPTDPNSINPKYLLKPEKIAQTEENDGTDAMPLNGLYEILIDFDEQTDLCTCEEAVQNVKATLNRHRNLCEDYVHIGVVETVKINICSLIDIEEDADVNEIAANIYFRLQTFLTPTLPFYSLAEILEKKKTASFDDIFEGVLLQNGFIDDDELDASDLKSSIHISDFYNIIRAIEGVKSVKGVQLRKEKAETAGETASTKTVWEDWQEWKILDIFTPTQTPKKPLLVLEGSNLDFRKRGSQRVIDQVIVEEKLELLRALNTPLSMRDKTAVSYPKVTARPNLTDYFTIQNEFPHVYHVGKEGIESNATEKRKAQVKQLKGYLTFFDQILTNYLGYLANVKNLLSTEQAADLPTRFSQSLITVPFIGDLLPNFGVAQDKKQGYSKPYDDFLATGLESKAEALHQKNNLLNHLIARFAETFSDYAMTRYYDDPKTTDTKDDYLLRLEQNLPEKVNFLHQIPEIGRERGKGFDYQKHLKNKPDVWDTSNVEGLKKRVCALLGIKDARRKTLTCPPSYKVVRFSSTAAKRGLSFLITDQTDKPLLEAFAPQPTEDRRRQHIKETLDALTGNVSFKQKITLSDAQKNLAITGNGAILNAKERADGKVYRFGYIKGTDFIETDKYNIILQKEGEVWRVMVLNDDEKIIAKSVCFFNKVGEVYDFLKDLKTVLFDNNCDSEGFHIVEHILLRPRCEDCLDGSKPAIDMRKCLNPVKKPTITSDVVITDLDNVAKYANDVKDSYSFWITVVASKNWQRFNHPTNQAYFEQTLRAETPAHIGVRVCWLLNDQMFDFETAYGTWLVELAQFTPDRCAVDEAAHNLVTVLNGLTCNCCSEEEKDLKLTCT